VCGSGGRRSDGSAGRSQEVKPCLVVVGDGISGVRMIVRRSLATVGHADGGNGSSDKYLGISASHSRLLR